MANGGDSCSSTEISEDGEILTPDDYHHSFNSDDYLNHFFDQKVIEKGTKLVLFALPNLLCRIPLSNVRILDVGSGPTTYVALCCRNIAQSIHLSDYALQNCEQLVKWKTKVEPYFDWKHVCRNISNVEGDPLASTRMQDHTREKVDAVWQCDVHDQNLLKSPAVYGNQDHKPEPYDVVVTIFCLESACSNYEEYCQAMQNVAAYVRPGGYLIICSVIEDDVYEFGPNNKFTLLYLTTDSIHEAMQKCGLHVCRGPSDAPIAYEYEGAYMVMAKKETLAE